MNSRLPTARPRPAIAAFKEAPAAKRKTGVPDA
jgi:hypothetical protein